MTPLGDALRLLGAGADLSADLAAAAIGEIMGGEATEARIAAFLTALHVKGETADELAGAVRAVRDRMVTLPEADPEVPTARPRLDTCGTGGDGANTINVSTAAAIVVASTGIPVVKHGNRSASGNSGSAEVLAELGVAFDPEPPIPARSLAELGLTFLFAPRYHPALRFAAPIRRQLPFRTLFNLIGPLANPARPDYQLIGVAGDRQAGLMAGALSRLGVVRAALVTGSDGLDEVTLGGPTRVRWVEGATIRDDVWESADFGLPRVEAAALRVSDPSESAERLRRTFRGDAGPDRDVILANASAALRVAGTVDDMKAGVERAAAAIDSGAAIRLLERWGRLTRGEV